MKKGELKEDMMDELLDGGVAVGKKETDVEQWEEIFKVRKDEDGARKKNRVLAIRYK